MKVLLSELDQLIPNKSEAKVHQIDLEKNKWNEKYISKQIPDYETQTATAPYGTK